MYLAFYLLAAHSVRGTRVCVNSPFTVTDFLVLLCHAIIRIDLLLQVEKSRGTTGNEVSVWVSTGDYHHDKEYCYTKKPDFLIFNCFLIHFTYLLHFFLWPFSLRMNM